MSMRNKLNNDYDNRNKHLTGKDYYFGHSDKDTYLDSYKNNTMRYNNPDFNGFYDELKQNLDKSWKDTKDIEKYNKQADTRPLHRKGSLNRAFDENIIHNIVKETLNRFLLFFFIKFFINYIKYTTNNNSIFFRYKIHTMYIFF